MDKNRIIELLTRKIAGEATRIELEELNRLMSDHPETLYYQEVLKEMWQQPVEGIHIGKIFRNHKLKYQDEFEFVEEPEEQKLNFQNGYKKYRQLLSAVCVLLIVSFVGFLFFYPETQSSSELQTTEIMSGKGVRKKVILPDGTKVWLNDESKLSYDPEMNKKHERSVQLSGEAFFDVAHDKSHPFTIKTIKYNIKVLGTAFNVRAYPSEKKSETTLIRGMIELSVNNQSHEKIVLKPSQKFSLIEKENSKRNDLKVEANEVRLVIENIEPVKIADKKYIEETSWVENKIVFQDESLEELVPKLERWYNVSIHIESEEVKSYHFTGVFTKESITEALSAMQLIRPFNFTFKGEDHDLIIITKE